MQYYAVTGRNIEMWFAGTYCHREKKRQIQDVCGFSKGRPPQGHQAIPDITPCIQHSTPAPAPVRSRPKVLCLGKRGKTAGRFLSCRQLDPQHPKCLPSSARSDP